MMDNALAAAWTPAQGMAWRPLVKDDVAQMVHVEAQAHTFPWQSAHFEDCLQSGYALQGVWHDQQLVGYFVAMRSLDETHLLNVTVLPSFQRQGIGAFLLDALTLWSRQVNATAIWLEVRTSNQHARRAYIANGFTEVAQRKNYYPAGLGVREDAVVMKKLLTKDEPHE